MPISSPNMSMPLPIPGVETGPTYASQISGYNNTSTTSCLQILDGHDHSFGKGVQVTPAGLNINANLPIGGNNLTAVRSVRFNSQVIPIPATSPDIGCVYFSGVDAYINDLSGNQIRLTQSGGVAGSPGSITGLVSPATVTYSAGTYIFQSAANTAGNLDAESIILRNANANSKGLTLNPPSSMGSNYSITLPLVTSSATSFLAMDTSGNITTPYPLSQGITRANLAPVGQSVSSTISINTTTTIYFPAAAATLTTSGRPVILCLIGTTSSVGNISVLNSGGAASMDLIFLRGATPISAQQIGNATGSNGNITVPTSSIFYFDPVTAGTYTYTLQVRGTPGQTGTINSVINNCVLVAYEL